MKNLFPVFLTIILIPIAFACKKGTNTTGIITNGVARVELTISPAVVAAGQITLDILTKSGNPANVGTVGSGGNYGVITIPSGATQYISDDFSVTEGQNFVYYLSVNAIGACYSITGKIYYNNVNVSSKTFSMGVGGGGCVDGVSNSHNAICK